MRIPFVADGWCISSNPLFLSYELRIGNKAWTLGLRWSGHAKFNSALDVNWLYSNKGVSTKGGLVRTAKAAKGEGSLTFLQVYEAGHMVPMDQPEAALALLNDFLTKKF